MIENNTILVADVFTVFKSLSEKDQERLADIGRGILLARGEKDGR